MPEPPTPEAPLYDSEDNATRLINAVMFLLLGAAGVVIGLWRLAVPLPGLIASLRGADYRLAQSLGLPAVIGLVLVGVGLLFSRLGYGQFRNALAVRRAGRRTGGGEP